MSYGAMEITQIALPAESRISRAYQRTHLQDAFTIDIPDNAVFYPETLASFLFAQQAPWVTALMKVRDFCVGPLGLKTTSQLSRLGEGGGSGRVHYFRLLESRPREVVMGEDDSHLDFRLSLLCQPPNQSAGSPRRLVFSTVVQCHNPLGRVYLAVIAPVHRMVVRSGLRRAGWPRVSADSARAALPGR